MGSSRGGTFQKRESSKYKAMKPLQGQNEALNLLSKVNHARDLIGVRVDDPTKCQKRANTGFIPEM